MIKVLFICHVNRSVAFSVLLLMDKSWQTMCNEQKQLEYHENVDSEIFDLV